MFKRADLFFLISALLAFLLANYLWFAVGAKSGFFVGLWIPSNLILALYFRNISKQASAGK
jgi:hypothetical protein